MGVDPRNRPVTWQQNSLAGIQPRRRRSLCRGTLWRPRFPGRDDTGSAHLWHHIRSPSLGRCLTCTDQPVPFSWSLLTRSCGQGARFTPTYNVGQVCMILLNSVEFRMRVPVTAPRQIGFDTPRRTQLAVIILCNVQAICVTAENENPSHCRLRGSLLRRVNSRCRFNRVSTG